MIEFKFLTFVYDGYSYYQVKTPIDFWCKHPYSTTKDFTNPTNKTTKWNYIEFAFLLLRIKT